MNYKAILNTAIGSAIGAFLIAVVVQPAIERMKTNDGGTQ